MISAGLRKVLIYLGVWSIILLGFYFLFWRPSFKELNTMQGEINQRQGLLDQLYKDIKAYPRTITDEALEKVEGNLRQVFTKIPAKEEIPAILDQIRAYSTQKANLEITAIVNVLEEKRGGGTPEATQEYSIPKTTYRIIAKGNAPDILRFFYELESGARLIAIEDVTIRRSNEETHTVNMEARLNIFYSNLAVGEAFDVGTAHETN